MQKSIYTDIVRNDDDLKQILVLLQQNVASALNEDEVQTQGFVTVEYSIELLRSMNKAMPSIIAKHSNSVVGYCLVLLQEFAHQIPILEPMFRILHQCRYKNKPLKEYTYFVMGQICVAKEYRGLALTDAMYAKLREVISSAYRLVVTEVAVRNTRSRRVHYRVGFQTIHTYTDSVSGEEWEIMLWDWTQEQV